MGAWMPETDGLFCCNWLPLCLHYKFRSKHYPARIQDHGAIGPYPDKMTGKSFICSEVECLKWDGSVKKKC